MKPWNPGMMTLIGFVISIAYIYSLATVFGLERDGLLLEMDNNDFLIS
jgi:P-type Cu2+ transporter